MGTKPTFEEWFSFICSTSRPPEPLDDPFSSDKTRLCHFITTAFLRADRLIAPLKVADSEVTRAFNEAESRIAPLDIKVSEAGLWNLIGAGKLLLYALHHRDSEPPLPSWDDRRALIQSNYDLCVGHLAKGGLTAADMWWEEFPSPPSGPGRDAYKAEVLTVLRRLTKHPDAAIARFGADALPRWEKI